MMDFPTEQRQYRFPSQPEIPILTEAPVVTEVFPSLPAIEGKHRTEVMDRIEPEIQMSQESMEIVVRSAQPLWYSQITSHNPILKRNPQKIVKANTDASLARRYVKQGEHRWRKRKSYAVPIFIGILVIGIVGGLLWIVTNKTLM